MQQGLLANTADQSSQSQSDIRDPDVDEVKRRLRSARVGMGLSQREVARRAGVSKSVIEKYESRDDRRIPNTKQLYRLANVFGLSMDYLVGRTEHPIHPLTAASNRQVLKTDDSAFNEWQKSF